MMVDWSRWSPVFDTYDAAIMDLPPRYLPAVVRMLDRLRHRLDEEQWIGTVITRIAVDVVGLEIGIVVDHYTYSRSPDSVAEAISEVSMMASAEIRAADEVEHALDRI